MPLHFACLDNRRDIVEILTGLGSRVNLKNRNGEYPIDLATDSGLICFLENLNASIYEKSDVSNLDLVSVSGQGSIIIETFGECEPAIFNDIPLAAEQNNEAVSIEVDAANSQRQVSEHTIELANNEQLPAGSELDFLNSRTDNRLREIQKFIQDTDLIEKVKDQVAPESISEITPESNFEYSIIKENDALKSENAKLIRDSELNSEKHKIMENQLELALEAIQLLKTRRDGYASSLEKNLNETTNKLSVSETTLKSLECSFRDLEKLYNEKKVDEKAIESIINLQSERILCLELLLDKKRLYPDQNYSPRHGINFTPTFYLNNDRDTIMDDSINETFLRAPCSSKLTPNSSPLAKTISPPISRNPNHKLDDAHLNDTEIEPVEEIKARLAEMKSSLYEKDQKIQESLLALKSLREINEDLRSKFSEMEISLEDKSREINFGLNCFYNTIYEFEKNLGIVSRVYTVAQKIDPSVGGNLLDISSPCIKEFGSLNDRGNEIISKLEAYVSLIEALILGSSKGDVENDNTASANFLLSMIDDTDQVLMKKVPINRVDSKETGFNNRLLGGINKLKLLGKELVK